MFAWANPDYMLNHMTFEQILMYWEYGVDLEEKKAKILTSRVAVGLFGAKEKPKNRFDDAPDRKAFYKAYSNRIKRPEGGEET